MNPLFCSQESRTSQCNQHGEFISKNIFREVWTKCPQCAAERQATEQREAEERASAERVRVWQKRLGEAGIPERFHSRTLANYKAENEGQRNALAFAQVYAEQFEAAHQTGRGAIFCGKPGTGKTHLAVGIGLRVMELNKSALFTTVQRMVRRIKDSWRKDGSESESFVIKLMVYPDLLILDEIGVQFGTEFEKNLLFDILNERYEKRRPTLLLSNLTVSEVRAFLGERIYDRLKEDGGKCVPFSWSSYRKGAA